MEEIKLGLLGNGISKTQSKKLHELIGELYNLNVSYKIMDLENQDNVDIKEELLRCQREGFTGVNVTHPYKMKAFECINEMDGFPSGLTSVNTVLLKNQLIADNTDYIGFKDAFKDKFPGETPGKVLMLGAGGVGLAIAFGLKTLKVDELIIHDMSNELVTSLVNTLQKVGVNAKALDTSVEVAMKNVDGIINATPIGMYQYPGCAFPKEHIKNQKWSFDAVYTPSKTEFLKTCETNGIETISGFKLFMYQGIEAFQRFCDIKIDEHLVEKEFLKRYPLQD
jgi:shikimate dehydrogenase